MYVQRTTTAYGSNSKTAECTLLVGLSIIQTVGACAMTVNSKYTAASPLVLNSFY